MTRVTWSWDDRLGITIDADERKKVLRQIHAFLTLTEYCFRLNGF
ncbi:hypothetical protein [Stieleria varia]|nr:hypothetical protein [Stieleria varia]